MKYALRKTVSAALTVLFTSFAASAVSLEATPWIGDGLPDREEAAWYAEDPAPEFTATFVAPQGAAEVAVSFAVAGFGTFAVNGTWCLAEDGLDTLWSVYDKTVYYQTRVVPVKPWPQVNRLRVRLGNGFYNLLPLRFWGGIYFRANVAHGRPCFKLAVAGVETPLAWTWRPTAVLRNSVYLGTEIDATRPEVTGWRPAASVAGPKGKLTAWPQKTPVMISDGVLPGRARWRTEGAVQVVDFGVNASGVPIFRFNEERGTRIEIVYGERLAADGSVNVLTQTAGQVKRPKMGGPGAPAVACQRDVFIASGAKDEVFTPPFTWHICRYAEVRGARRLLQKGEAGLRVRSMVSLTTGGAPAAKAFVTADRELAAIHTMCRRTFQANLIGGIQSDCPGRERLGYGGDIVATAEAYMLNFDMREIYLKILRDFADEAADDGWITETAPYVGIGDRGFGGRAGPISWALAVPELIDGLLRHYNETRALAYYPVCARYVRLVDARCPSGLVPTCIGDHEGLRRVSAGCLATAHWHRFVALTASLAGRTGRPDDQKAFEAIAAKIRTAFAAKYVRNGVVDNGTLSAQASALYLGLVPEAQRAAAHAKLLNTLAKTGYAPTTGIFSTRYLLLYLSENGRVDLARKVVLHRGFPGWLHMLERGATTLWETWRESDNIFSNCHPMFGSVDEWILKYGGGSR
jgi:alpha-L-rhamnosidase